MNIQVVAILIQEGTKLISELLKTRPHRFDSLKIPENVQIVAAQVPEQPTVQPTRELIETNAEKEGEKGKAVKTGCIPCALGHVGTCSGVLNEAMRFARADGVQSGEVIDRVNMCLDELNSMERIDLRPERTVALPTWEKELVDETLVASRQIRHGLEGLKSVEELEQVAADTQAIRQKMGRAWFEQKMKEIPPEERTAIKAELKKRKAAQAATAEESTKAEEPAAESIPAA